jgi:hypothetical protein
MKRCIILVLVVVVIGLGFYFGYNRAKEPSRSGPAAVLLPQFPTTDSVQFKYSISTANTTSSRMRVINWTSNNSNQQQKAAVQINGTMKLQSIFSAILSQRGMAPMAVFSSGMNPPPNFQPMMTVTRQNNFSIVKVKLESAIENKNYDIELSFPVDEPRESVLNKVAADLNLTYSKNESTTAGYRISWKDQQLQFPATMKPIHTTKAYTAYTFNIETGNRMTTADRKTSAQNTTYVSDFESIDIPAMMQSWGDGASYSSEEEAIQILKDKKGIEIKPIELDIIELEVKPK